MNNKTLLIIGIALLVIAGVSIASLMKTWKLEVRETSPTDVGVVRIDCTSEPNFPVSDEDSPGWKWGERGVAVLTLYFVLEDTANKGATVSTINWTLYDASGAQVTSGSTFVGKTIDRGGSTEASIIVALNEGHANQIDDAADGVADDFTGSGIFEFTLQGRDAERGGSLNYIPDFASMSVSLPPG